MAEQTSNQGAEASTETVFNTPAQSRCPTWDKLGVGADLPPFFCPSEGLKREGFNVTFLTDQPRRETPCAFDSRNQELWFDIKYQGQVLTWTISQISLLLELRKHAPLGGKSFLIKLVPVDEEFKKKLPNYKGKDRYMVTLVEDEEEIVGKLI